MTSIKNLFGVDELSPGDAVPVYSRSGSNTRRVSVSLLTATVGAGVQQIADEAQASADAAAESEANAAATLAGALKKIEAAAPDGATLVGTPEGTVQEALDGRVKTADAADTTTNTKGAGLLGFGPALAYAAGTVGAYLRSLAASGGAALVGFLPSGVDAVSTDVQSQLRQFVTLNNFGAVGDGVTNDRDAIRKAIAYAKLTGAGLIGDAKATYYVGTFPNTTGEIKFLIDFDNFYFEPNNCKFTATANLDASLAASYKQNIFVFQDASNGHIGDFRCEADAVERTGTQTGVLAVGLSNVAANGRNISLGTITGTRLMAVLACYSSDPATYRYRSIRFDKLQNDAGYYTMNFSENGDGVSGTIYSNNVVRSYFVYGVDGHNVTVHSTNHFKFSDIVIKRYTRDTKNIKVFYTGLDDASVNAAISIEHQNDTDNGLIQNVWIDFEVSKSSTANPTLNFTAFTLAGAVRTSMSSRTDCVYIRGVTNSGTPVTLTTGIGGTNGENISRLYVQRSLLAGISDYKRFITLDTDRRMVARSNAAGGMAIKFNVSEFKFTPNWGLLTVWGGDNPGASSAEYIMRQYFVLFTVNSSGDVSIGTTTTIATQTAGALGPTITIPAQTGTFNLEVDVNNYTNANRQCSATLEVFRVV